VWIDLEPAEGRLELGVSDDGPAFDPLAMATPDIDAPLEERPIGGLGIYLVREMMAGVSYERRDGRNVLRMWKPL
jgi:serine/threonine-protein kinase RsbW